MFSKILYSRMSEPIFYGSLIFSYSKKFQIWCQDALRQLWRLSYPDRPLPSLKSELWKEMGWQGSDPSTDFRYKGCIFDSEFCCASPSGAYTEIMNTNVQGWRIHIIGEPYLLCQDTPGSYIN